MGRSSASPDERLAEFRAWVKNHPALPYEADDSRASIYKERD